MEKVLQKGLGGLRIIKEVETRGDRLEVNVIDSVRCNEVNNDTYKVRGTI